MSKLSTLILFSLGISKFRLSALAGIAVLGCSFSSHAQVQVSVKVVRHGADYFIVAKDNKGFSREYSVSNAKAYVYELLDSENKQVLVTASFKKYGLRSGRVKIFKFGPEDFNPLGL